MSRKKLKRPNVNLVAILTKRVTIKVGNNVIAMHPHEAAYRAMSQKAMGGDIRACRRLLQECEAAGLIVPPEPVDDHQYQLIVPKDWDWGEWMEMYDRLGPPPWRGNRDGLTAAAREERKTRGRKRL